MTLPASFNAEAQAELQEAALVIEADRPGWGARLVADVMQAVALICDAPGMGSRVGRSRRRRLVLADFPYVVVYREDDGAIRVLAVAHTRRRPGYFRSRT